jgi:hypothetical protein
MARQARWGLLVAGIVLALVAALASAGRLDPAVTVLDLAAGLILMGAGIVAWDLRPRSRVGILVAAIGLAWLAGTLVPAALYLHRGLLAFLLLSYPTGILSDRLSVIAVVAACLYGALLPMVPSELATLAFAVALPVLAVGRMLRASGPVRRGRASAAAASVAFGLVLAAGSLGRLAGADIDWPVLLAYELVITTIGLGLVADQHWGRWSQAAVTGLVIELGELAETGTLRDRLARALGDPSLVVGYWIGDEARAEREARAGLLQPQEGGADQPDEARDVAEGLDVGDVLGTQPPETSASSGLRLATWASRRS